MTYYLYEVGVKIVDPSLTDIIDTEGTFLTIILAYAFTPERLQNHDKIIEEYRFNQKCLKAVRTYDLVQYTMSTKRYFASMEDASAMKADSDVIYNACKDHLIKNGTFIKFEIIDSITAISDDEFNQVEDSVFP